MTERFALLQLKGKAGPLTYYKNVAVFQMLGDCICTLKGSEQKHAKVILTYCYSQHTYLLIINRKKILTIPPPQLLMMTVVGAIIIPYPNCASHFFQIPMFYFCVFVRGEGLGDFFPSVSQTQKIRVKGRVEKCWKC